MGPNNRPLPGVLDRAELGRGDALRQSKDLRPLLGSVLDEVGEELSPTLRTAIEEALW
jgi:hypothetical protein